MACTARPSSKSITGINRMSSPSTVLVFEFFTGGGCPEGELPAGLAAEALGMLWGVLEDFRRWGAVRTITALDSRFEQLIPGLNRKTLPADEVVRALPGEHEEVYLSLLKRCDAVLVIAPETDGILSRLTEQAEIEGIPLLGSSSSAAATAGNKAICSRLFDLANLPTPKTRIATFSAAPQVARQMGLSTGDQASRRRRQRRRLSGGSTSRTCLKSWRWCAGLHRKSRFYYNPSQSGFLPAFLC